MDDLIIIGAGGTSREIADTVAAINRIGQCWNLLGFLDDDPTKQGALIDKILVLGKVSTAASYSAQFVIGVGSWRSPDARHAIVSRLALPDERYATVIHPTAQISPHASIGPGCAILQNVVITPGTIVGKHCLILQNVTMAHDQVVEDYVTIASGATVAGFVRLREGCYLGAGCTIMSGMTVNRGALVGAGAVVLNEVADGVTVLGNPARPLPTRRRG